MADNGSNIWTKAFWKAAFERALKTFAQALAGFIVGDGTDILHTAWNDRLALAGTMALVSILTSIGTDAVTKDGPSMVDAEHLDPTA